MKKWIDEREEREIEKTGSSGFLIMFVIAVIVILLQMVLFNGDIRQVGGESVILLSGGIYVLASHVRNGRWDVRKRRLGIKEYLILSFCVSLLTTVLLAVTIYLKYGGGKNMMAWSGISFCIIFLLCMAVLGGLGIVSNKRKLRLEEEFCEDDGRR